MRSKLRYLPLIVFPILMMSFQNCGEGFDSSSIQVRDLASSEDPGDDTPTPEPPPPPPPPPVMNGTTVAAPLKFTPTMLVRADGGTVGSTYQGNGAEMWTGAAGDTIVDNAMLFRGTKSFRMHATKGEQGFGYWGGVKDLNTNLTKGDIAHVQVSVYIPADFDWKANPWLKFLRLRTGTPSGQNRGYADLYIYEDGSLNAIKEVEDKWYKSTGFLKKGRWEVIEFKVSLDNVPRANGGNGYIQVWQAENGVMVNRLDVSAQTLTAATDIMFSFYMFTYWNSGAEDGRYPSKSQHLFVDQIIIETNQNKLVETDAAGRKIIGGITAR